MNTFKVYIFFQVVVWSLAVSIYKFAGVNPSLDILMSLLVFVYSAILTLGAIGVIFQRCSVTHIPKLPWKTARRCFAFVGTVALVAALVHAQWTYTMICYVLSVITVHFAFLCVAQKEKNVGGE